MKSNKLQLPMFDTVESVTNEAVSFVIENLKDKGEIFVGFSGGKDSICIDKLMQLSGLPYKLFYSFTGIDPPEIVKFIRNHYPDCIFLKPKTTFWKKLSVNIPPSDRIRWCCTFLKKNPSYKMPHKHRVMGIRSEESIKRSKYQRINPFVTNNTNHIQYYPILNWKEYHIWEFIEQNNLPYSSLYDEGFDRIGCVICPYHSEKTGKLHQKYRSKWNQFFVLWEKSIYELYYKRVSQGKQMYYPSPQDFCNAWYKSKNARWYKS